MNTTRERLFRAARGAASIAAAVAVLTVINVMIRRSASHGRHTRMERQRMTSTSPDVGPVDIVVIRFIGNTFTGEVTPALLDLVRAGTIRVLDALFVYRGPDGAVGSIEIGGLGPDLQAAFVSIDGRAGVGVLDHEDVLEVGGDLDVDTSALLLVVENTWAGTFAGACRRAGGELVDIARVPSKAVAEALAPLSAAGPIGA